MSKVIKIVLIGDSKDQMSLLMDFARSKSNGWSNPKTNLGMAQAALQVKNEAVTVQIYSTPDQGAGNYGTEIVRLLQDAHVVLTVVKPSDQNYQNLDEFVEQTIANFNFLITEWLFKDTEYSEETADSGYLLPLFHINAKANSVISLRSKFTAQGKALNITVTESGPSFIANYLKNRLLPVIDRGRIVPREEVIVEQAVPAKVSLNVEDESLAFLNNVSGMLLSAMFGTLTAIVVYNPLASLFAAASGLLKNKTFEDFLWLLISPIWGPLYGIFYKGLYLQGLQGWEKGFMQSLSALPDVAKNAALKEKTPISTRNIVASLSIIALSLAAVASVLIVPVNLLLAIPSFIAFLDLSGISTSLLALLAGGLVLTAVTVLYALGVQLADYAFDCSLTGNKRGQPGHTGGSYKQLVGEGSPLASNVSAGAPAVTDGKPEDALGAKSIPPLASTQAEPAATTQNQPESEAVAGLVLT